MKSAITALTVALSIASAAPAMGQDSYEGFDRSQVGTRFLQEPETADQQTARWLQKRIANCVFNRNDDEMRELLANSDFYSIDFPTLGIEPDNFFEEFEVGHCMGRVMRGRYRELSMQYQYSTLRNLLAEEAYIIEYDGPPEISANTPREIAARFAGRRVHPQVSTMAALADCLVFEAVDGADALLRSRPGSGSESEAIAALGPVIVGCASTRERELTIPTSLIRQIAADGLWSRSYYGAVSFEMEGTQ